ncbi:MAG: A24 family peptidase [Nanoarchaeota archaeon]
MLEITLPSIIALIGLLVGSYTDFKTREVPDWVNYGLIISGFGINTIYSIVFSSWAYILYSMAGFGLCFVLSLLMFYTGQWGGGDSKMLMAIGALLGFNFKLSHITINFLINIIFIGGFYGLIWSIYLSIKNRSRLINIWKKLSANKTAVRIKNIIFTLVFLLVLVGIILRDNLSFFYMGTGSIILILTFYIWIFIKSIENVAMIKSVTPYKLTEGDWIAKDISLDGKYICGPKDLGISKTQIKALKRFYNLGRIKKVVIKEGIPFVPSLLIAYVITLFEGSILTIFLSLNL